MHTALRVFITEFAGAVAVALLPVLAVAFISMPQSLGGFPGEPRVAGKLVGAPAERHLS